MPRSVPGLAALILVSAAGLGDPVPARAGESTPVDPQIILADVARAYRAGPTAERVDVSVSTDGASRSEPLTVVIHPPEGVRIEMGQLVAWSDGKIVRVVHRLDMKSYFEARVEGGLLKTLERLLPPLPLPELALAFGGSDLTPYSRGVRWTEAELRPDDRPAAAILHGTGERSGVELTADAASGRLRHMRMELEAGRSRIDLAVTPLEAPPGAPLGEELGARTRVSDLAELRPRPGDAAVGSPFPDMVLSTGLMAEGRAEVKGQGAVVMFREWGPGSAGAVAAARSIADDKPGFQIWPVLVLDMIEPRARARIDEIGERVEPLTLAYSLSPQTTIERFSATAKGVLVVVDGATIVRAVIPLDATPADEKDEAERLVGVIRAAIAAREK